MLRLKFSLSVILLKGENLSVRTIRYKVLVSCQVSNLKHSGRLLGIAKPVSLYLLIVSLTVLVGIPS